MGRCRSGWGSLLDHCRKPSLLPPPCRRCLVRQHSSRCRALVIIPRYSMLVSQEILQVAACVREAAAVSRESSSCAADRCATTGCSEGADSQEQDSQEQLQRRMLLHQLPRQHLCKLTLAAMRMEGRRTQCQKRHSQEAGGPLQDLKIL